MKTAGVLAGLCAAIASPSMAASLDILVGSGGGIAAKVQPYVGLAPQAPFEPFPGFTGEVRVAVGDVTGDGRSDIIAAAGPGGGPHVKVFDGMNGAVVRNFFAYEPAFLGGVFVGAGDIDGDGRAEIVTAPDAGGGSRVRVFDGATGNVQRDFFAFDSNYLGGVTVAVGDALGDGTKDIFAGTASASSRISVFNATSLAKVSDFFAFDVAYKGGVTLATGRYQGVDALIVGAAAGSSQVKVFRLSDLSLIDSFLAFDGDYDGGVNVGAGSIEGRDSLIFGMVRGGSIRAIDVSLPKRGVPRARDIRLQPFGAGYEGRLSVALAAPGAVPEPGVWVQMLCGFGLLGFVVRRRTAGQSEVGRFGAI